MSKIDAAVVGSGGREYELGRQLGLADDIEHVYFLNGNAGTELLPKGENIGIKPTAIDDIVAFSDAKRLGLILIGPEAPLVAGAADRLRAKGHTVFGPSAEAAQLEASKAYATMLMRENNIPRPATHIAESFEQALRFIAGREADSYVIKADGLAGGKGVVLPKSPEEAKLTLKHMFFEGGFDGAGKDRVIIQNRFHGPEVSAFVVSDGKRFEILPFAQDHKRLLEGDEGPNTGGMGAYSPLPFEIVSPKQERQIQDIAERTIRGMAMRGVPYQGVLFMGLMLAEELGGDPVVIEFNARFGDPETQVVLSVLSEAGVDVYDMLRSTAEGRLSNISIPQSLGCTALTTILAAEGYPDNPKLGQTIYGLNQQYDGVIVHHAGTRRNGPIIETFGGRVLGITGLGKTADEAAANVERAIGHRGINFKNMQYRTDIGHQVRK